MAEDITRKVIQQAQEDLKGIGPAVAAQPQKGWWEAAKDWFIDKFAPEVGDMLMHKTAQGAAEIAQALNSQSNAYVPYGVGQSPLEVEGPATNYQDLLREAQQRAVPKDQDKGLER
jgi:hypothetical protein